MHIVMVLSFVILRGKESTTNQLYQPFVLRYVGQQTARQMHDKDVCMEEMTFEEN